MTVSFICLENSRSDQPERPRRNNNTDHIRKSSAGKHNIDPLTNCLLTNCRLTNCQTSHRHARRPGRRPGSHRPM